MLLCERVIYVSKNGFLFLFLVFLLTGCSFNGSKPVYKKDITCHTDDTSFVLKLENGQIVKYIDSIDGELGQETVDILNQEHLQGVTDNEEALKIMNLALSDLNGGCE